MSESTASEVILLQPIPFITRERAKSRSQPLDAINEDERDERALPSHVNADTGPSLAQPLQRVNSIETVDDLRYPGDTMDRRAIADSFFNRDERTMFAESPSAIAEQPKSFIDRTISRIPSHTTTDTFIPLDPGMDPTTTLLSLLETIGRHRSLQYARVVQADSYERVSRGVKHRFIILELEREERQRIWLRMDRRIKKTGLFSAVRSIAGGASSLADDRVWFSADQAILSEGLPTEHTTPFVNAALTLGDLRWVLLAIVQYLERYELFGANCWFLVSFVFEALGVTFYGGSIARFLYRRKEKEGVQSDMLRAARLVLTFPFEDVPPFLVEPYGDINNFYHAMLSQHIDPLDIKLTSTACSIASSISLETFVSEALLRSDEFQKLPSSLQRAALRLVRILRDERGLTGQSQWSEQFNAFMHDSSGESPFFMRSIPPDNMSATACLAIMAEELHFNMCKFPSSFVPNEKVANLKALAVENISPQLGFACRHWTEQVAKIEVLTDELLKRLSFFFELNFLPWLEVVSCFDLYPSEMLQDLNQTRIPALSEELDDTIKDAILFTETFAVPIESSIPHIYLSALAFAPSSRRLFIRTRQFLHRRAVSQSGELTNWPALSQARIVVGEDPSPELGWTIALSPQDPTLASGSSDGRLLIWDVKARAVVRTLLPSRTAKKSILCIAFSPDGTRLVAGSGDGIIRLWDTKTWGPARQLQAISQGAIFAVALSPDGKRVASGSQDNYVSQWDPTTGKLIGKPILAHDRWVRSVVFSPDSRRVISASDDNTIKLWNARTEEAIGNPLKGHTEPVQAVACSPDGKYIASGSRDGTIRVWNVKKEKQFEQSLVLVGHSYWVMSVAFSPDGAWIASGSVDKTVRLWDVKTGKMVGEPLTGVYNVSTVAFSRTGDMLVSGTTDGTIQLWPIVAGGSNTQKGTSTPSPSPHYVFDQRDRSTSLNSSPPNPVHPANLRPLKDLRIKDGWILGPKGELILWLHLGLRSVAPFIPEDVISRIDFSSFACGTEWTQCWHEGGEAEDVESV